MALKTAIIEWMREESVRVEEGTNRLLEELRGVGPGGQGNWSFEGERGEEGDG